MDFGLQAVILDRQALFVTKRTAFTSPLDDPARGLTFTPST